VTQLTDRAAVRAFLEESYRPVSPRMQVMLGSPIPEVVEEEAVRIVTERGLVPERRLNRLQSRPGESALRTDDVVDFLERYGHEYCAALFPLSGGLDRDRIAAAAATERIDLGWTSSDLT
jgi:kynureninase